MRLKEGWTKTPIIWFPIPVGLGLAFISFQHYLHIRKKEHEQNETNNTKIIAAGPWQVN